MRRTVEFLGRHDIKLVLLVCFLCTGFVDCIKSFEMDSIMCSLDGTVWSECPREMQVYDANHYFVKRNQVWSDRPRSVALLNNVGLLPFAIIDHPESDEVFLMLGVTNNSDVPIILDPDCVSFVSESKKSSSSSIVVSKRLTIEREEDGLDSPERTLSTAEPTTSAVKVGTNKVAIVRAEMDRPQQQNLFLRFTVRTEGGDVLMWKASLKRN